MRKKTTAVFVSIVMTLLAGCEATGPKYRNVRSFSEGLAPVQAANGRWGFINERQQWMIEPRFEDAREFQAGKAAVRQSGKWGFINRRGEWL